MPGPDTSALGPADRKAPAKMSRRPRGGWVPGVHFRAISRPGRTGNRSPAASLLPPCHACMSISLRSAAVFVLHAHTSAVWPVSARTQTTTPVHNGVYHWYQSQSVDSSITTVLGRQMEVPCATTASCSAKSTSQAPYYHHVFLN